MKKIYNGTAHAVSIIKNGVSDPAIRKLVVPEGEQPAVLMSIPSDGMLMAKIENSEESSIETIPVFGKRVVGCDPLPEGYDVIIVSALFATAARMVGMDTSRLYTVANPVYSPGGKEILGCLGLSQAL